MSFKVGDIVVIKTVEEIEAKHGSLRAIKLEPDGGWLCGKTVMILNTYTEVGVDVDIPRTMHFQIMPEILRLATEEEIAVYHICRGITPTVNRLLAHSIFGCQTWDARCLCKAITQSVSSSS